MLTLFAAVLMMVGPATPQAEPSRSHALSVERPRFVVVTDTKGFRHDSIPVALEEVTKLCAARGWPIKHVPSASFDQPGSLEGVDVVVFLLTTGDILGEAGKAALQAHMKRGGGFVGVHSASDTHHGWTWYRDLVGAAFVSHPAIAQATVRVEDHAHPSTVHLPAEWIRTDEWYDLAPNPRGKVHVLCSLDEKTYAGGKMGDDHPITWCQEVDGGRSWYTAMGHTDGTYREPAFMQKLAEGMLWAAQGRRPSGAQDLKWKSEQGWTSSAEGLFNQGNAPHLVTAAEHGDALVHVEFKLPKGSNSGVYLQGRYEVQIFDSYGKAAKDLRFDDAGGIYQRWKDGAGFEGSAPLHNALRPPGEWNAYDILFRAPRFDAAGKKTADAKVVEVRLNGVVVQRDVSLTGPTRASLFEDERALGPLMLQGDHGPVTFRRLWILPLAL